MKKEEKEKKEQTETKIVQQDNPVLRQKAKSLSLDEIKSPETSKIISEMKLALNQEPDGVALAAPQIGISKRIFIIDEKIAKIVGNNPKHFVYINPVILKISSDKKLVDEGCLSVRYWYGKIRRATRVEIEAYDPKGKKFREIGTGLFAQIFQHETDHLDGKLFVDKAQSLRQISEEEIAEIENQKSQTQL